MVKRYLTCFVTALCLSLCLMPCTVLALSTADAADPISLTEECTLTAVYSCEGRAFADIQVPLFYVAEISADLRFSYTDEFAFCGLPLNGIRSDSEWDALRSTLETYIIADAMPPCATGKTNGAGEVVFEGLEAGMYFIPSIAVDDDGVYCAFSCSLVALPGLDPEDQSWSYHVSVLPKPDMSFIPTYDELSYKVLKLWRDTDNSEARPDGVEIDILRNGVTVETVLLSEENNWTYTWVSENDGSVWTVIERNIPDGYFMTLEKRSTTFIVTNTIEPDETEEPEETEEPDETEEPEETSPQTGDTSSVSLYILLLCLSGVMLIIVGVTGKRREE